MLQDYALAEFYSIIKVSFLFGYSGPCRYGRSCANAHTAPGFRLLSLSSIPRPALPMEDGDAPSSRLRLAP
jgi:hypothetical protein